MGANFVRSLDALKIVIKCNKDTYFVCKCIKKPLRATAIEAPISDSGVAISPSGRICSNCFSNWIVKSEDRPRSSYIAAQKEPSMRETNTEVPVIVCASSSSSAAPPAIASEQSLASTSNVVNYDESFGIINNVLSCASNIQQKNSTCDCDHKKGEICRLCISDLNENQEAPAAADSNLVQSKKKNGDVYMCSFCKVIEGYNERNHFDDASCNLCDKTFKCKGLLQRHMSRETVYCKSCRKKLHGSYAIILHETTNECSFCKKSFDCESRLHLHMTRNPACRNFFAGDSEGATDKSTTLNCYSCSVKLKTLREKTGHQVEQVCPCGMKFRCRNQFTSHRSKCGNPEKTKTTPSIKCKNCSVKCKSAKELKAHLKKKLACDDCGQNFPCSTLSSHKCEKACGHCGETVSTIDRSTHADGTLKCRGCGQKTPCKGALERHEKTCEKLEEQEISTSSGANKHQSDDRCCYCQEGFVSPAELQAHVAVSNCPRCGFLQPCRTLLGAHLRDCRFEAIHGQHRCPMCTKTFQSADYLGTHVVLEHSAGKNRQGDGQQPKERPQVKQESRVVPEVVVLD